jgi:hypothetical protein
MGCPFPIVSLMTFVRAAVSVVLPWSTWPIVPMLTCGLVRAKTDRRRRVMRNEQAILRMWYNVDNRTRFLNQCLTLVSDCVGTEDIDTPQYLCGTHRQFYRACSLEMHRSANLKMYISPSSLTAPNDGLFEQPVSFRVDHLSVACGY